MLMQNERNEAERQGLMQAAALIQRYQKVNWRRLRVNEICSDIRRLTDEEAARVADRIEASHS